MCHLMSPSQNDTPWFDDFQSILQLNHHKKRPQLTFGLPMMLFLLLQMFRHTSMAWSTPSSRTSSP